MWESTYGSSKHDEATRKDKLNHNQVHFVAVNTA